MRALLGRRVDIAWLLLAAALSGGLLVVWLAVQSGSMPSGPVYIVQAAATSVAGHGGAPSGQMDDGTNAASSRLNTISHPEPVAETPTPEPATATVPSASDIASDSLPTATAPVTGARIDINKATATELERLPGIGPVLAGRIVRYREANGPFATVDDLDWVEGIGEGIIAKIRDYVVAGP